MSQRPKGLLIAFEGLDQSGKQTQAEATPRSPRIARPGMPSSSRFPTTRRRSAARSRRGLHGEREYGPDVMQLLYVANRHEKKPDIERALGAGTTIICDRYIASSIAYGEAHGLDPRWLTEIQRFLPPPDLASCSTSLPRPRRSGRPPGATSTSAISRSCLACARATIVRPRPRRAGCAWTANALATPSGRTCSRQSRHDSRRGEGADVPRPGPPQRDGARVQRRAGSGHIVHEQHCQPIDRRDRSRSAEGIPDVRVPPRGRQVGLRRCCPRPAQQRSAMRRPRCRASSSA